MKLLSGLLVFSCSTMFASQAQPIRCGKGGDAICKMTYFDRVEDKVYPANTDKPPKGPDPNRDLNYVAIIRGAGTKVLYSGTILDATYTESVPDPTSGAKPETARGQCSDQDWRVVAMAKESSNILIYGPADVSEFCNNDSDNIVVILPVTVIWAQLYSSKGNLSDPLRKSPGKITPAAESDHYCRGEGLAISTKADPPFDPVREIRTCDRYSWISFMYDFPAGPIWNSWTQPGASQGTISFTPAIGKVPNTSGAPPGEKVPSETLTFDVQEYPSQMWGYGYVGVPIVFEKANAPTANLNSLIFGVSYDVPFAAHHPKSSYSTGQHPWKLFIRWPDLRIQYGPEMAVSTPHDINLTAAFTARVPIGVNMPRQPSVLTIFPVVGLEGGNHISTHLSETDPIFRRVAGYDSSLRVPFVITHAFLGDKPATIDFSWRTRYLSYNEPFTDYVSGIAERLAKQQRSYWRGSFIVPFSQLAQFKVTVQHGGLPPDFDYLGYSVNLGLTLGNPGYSEH